MKDFLHRKLVAPLLALLQQGASPDSLALCVSVGIVIGLIPILGLSTLMCTAIAVIFGMNLPAIQIAQASMAPLQILLIIPFVRLGEWLTQATAQPLSIKAGLVLFDQGVWHAVSVLRDAIFHAGVAWLLVAPFAVILLYRMLNPVFVKVAKRIPS